MGSLSEDALPDLYSKCLGLSLVSDDALEQWIPEQDHLEFPGLSFLLDRGWLPFTSKGDRQWLFLTNTPIDNEVADYLRWHCDSVERVLCSRAQFTRLADQLKLGQAEQSASDFSLSHNEEQRLRELASEAPTVNLLNSLIARALNEKASDIHIEPVDGRARVRFRVDGVLQDKELLASNLQLPLVSRVKILSGMDIAERRRPQDGKIETRVANVVLDIRASALPLDEGESVVLRLLRKDALSYSFNNLALLPDTAKAIQEDLSRTTGVILMTGPTGSGKTTTLYTFLSQLNKPGVKIITLEDPVEYQLDGLNQVQVNSDIGFDFKAGLRSVVRQDPDIIMVGEIRDAETSRIALQSALTGHLVFSTVHTNDAASAFTRLLDLGVQEYLLNAALVSILAQRLVRRVCEHCAETSDSKDEDMARYGLNALVDRFSIDNPTLLKAKGCEACNHTGYQGRLAVIEYLRVDDHIKQLPKNDQFLAAAAKSNRDQGFRNLFEDGAMRALMGETTLEEVLRVCG
jgi:general secretion pathway protein E